MFAFVFEDRQFIWFIVKAAESMESIAIFIACVQMVLSILQQHANQDTDEHKFMRTSMPTNPKSDEHHCRRTQTSTSTVSTNTNRRTQTAEHKLDQHKVRRTPIQTNTSSNERKATNTSRRTQIPTNRFCIATK